MSKLTVEFTRKQFEKVGPLAQMLDLATECGTGGQRVRGTEEELRVLEAVLKAIALQGRALWTPAQQARWFLLADKVDRVCAVGE